MLTVIAVSAGVRPRFKKVTIRDGLNQSTVRAMAEDATGYIWIGSIDGVNRYDGYSVSSFRPDSKDPHSIAGALVEFILTDSKGRLWIGFGSDGLDRFDPDSGRFIHHRQAELGKYGPSEDGLSAAYLEASGSMLIGTENGFLDRFDPDTGRFKNIPLNPEQSPLRDFIRVLYADRDGKIWIGLRSKGLYVLHPDGRLQPLTTNEGFPGMGIRDIVPDDDGHLWIGFNGGLARVEQESGEVVDLYTADANNPNSLPSRLVEMMVIDNYGNLWVGTQQGFALFDEASRSFYRFNASGSDPFSLSDDHIRTLFKSRDGLIWIGTVGTGLCYFDPSVLAVAHYKNDPNHSNSLSDNIVWGMDEDREGGLWLATNRGGLNHFDPHTKVFKHYRADPSDPTSLSDDFTRDVLVDHLDRVWVTTRGFGVSRLNRTTLAFDHYSFSPDQKDSLSNNFILVAHQDHQKRIWFGSYFKGANLLKNDESGFLHFLHEPENANSLSSNRIWDMDSESSGRIWLATSHGLNALDPDTGRVVRYLHNPEDATSLSHNYSSSVLVDSQGQVWCGTNVGLNRLKDDGTFKIYREEDGLLNDYVYSLVEDQSGFIWAGTNFGLLRLDPKTDEIRNFTEDDGLQSNEFNAGSGLLTFDGALHFGGINGFNRFYPEKLAPVRATPDLNVTSILRLNVPLKTRLEDPRSPMAVMPSRVSSIAFSHEDYLVGFEFAAFDFMNPESVTYAYKLDGFDEEWIVTPASRRIATYTSLPAGDYTFRIKAASKNANWRESEQRIDLKIEPPIWQTTAAYVLYTLLSCCLIWLFLRRQEQKLKDQRNEAEKERRTNDRLRQVDHLKDEFLANTSHELRTPLNGIIGLAESLLDGATGELNEDTRENLSLITTSGRRLAALVNDILDFSKLKSHNLTLALKPVDVKTMVDVVIALSRPLIGNKKIVLENTLAGDLPPVMADENRLQQILHNLIGNALKFTERGYVRVAAEVEGETLWVRVSDSGIGIKSDDQSRVFGTFEQGSGDATRFYGGTGLGLALTRRLVMLHGGMMTLESTYGQGSTFSFSLPTTEEAVEKRGPSLQGLSQHYENVVNTQLGQGSASVMGPQGVEPSENHEWSILIVDDEPINRQVLLNHLSLRNYRTAEACDGPEALAHLAESHFDLVLLDVMMPRMSGYEVCRRLRETFGVHELPVLFLTARNQVMDLKEAFKLGANDYLTKPVSKDELLSRIKTHLDLLDTNRNLETRVEERTRELQERNQELDDRNRQILETRDQLILQEKMASLGTLTAGIAHEIRNPLNFINGFAQVSADLSQELRTDLKEERESLKRGVWEEMDGHLSDLTMNTSKIHEYGLRANQIVQSMIVLSQGEGGEKESTDLNALVNEFTNLAWQGRSALWERELAVTIEKFYDEKVGIVDVVAQDLSRSIICLVNNALEALAERAETENDFAPKLEVRTKSLGESQVEILIVDNGPGISEENLVQVFTPFFTTRHRQRNVGLGLSLCHEVVVREHGGLLKIDSQPGQTIVRIRLPRNSGKPNTQKIA